MTDYVQVNPANSALNGPKVRTVAKTANGGVNSQVNIIDVGGGADGSPEIALTAGQAAMANSLPVTMASDQPVYQSGCRDNGTNQGVVGAEITYAGLVSVNLRSGFYSGQNNGSASGYSGIPGAFTYGNGDGTATGLQLTVPSSATLANYISMFVPFKGRVFGLRFGRDATYGNLPISIRIDGVIYPVAPLLIIDPVLQTVPSVPVQANENWVLVATDLDPFADHFAEIVFIGNLTISRTWLFFGWVLDRLYYQPAQLGVLLQGGPLAVTASWLQAPYPTGCDGVWGYHFFNTTGSPITVSLRFSSGNGPFWVGVVPANGSKDYPDAGPNVPLRENYQVSGSGTGVNCFAKGVPHAG